MKKNFFVIPALLLTNLLFSQNQEKIEENRFLKKVKNKYGITDSVNEVIVPFVYDFIEYKNNRLIARKQNATGLLTTDNKILIPIQYAAILPRGNNRFILWTQKSIDGLCDIDGKIILPVKYQRVSSTENDDFYITENDKGLNGVYDIYGKNILPEIYTFFTIDNYKIFAFNDSFPQILDLQRPNDIVYLDKDITFIETLYHITIGEQRYQIVKKQNKYGLLNADNQIIIPIIYDEVKSSSKWNYFIIKKNGKIGLMNVNGQMVKETVYDGIQLMKESVVLKRKGQKD